MLCSRIFRHASFSRFANPNWCSLIGWQLGIPSCSLALGVLKDCKKGLAACHFLEWKKTAKSKLQRDVLWNFLKIQLCTKILEETLNCRWRRAMNGYRANSCSSLLLDCTQVRSTHYKSQIEGSGNNVFIAFSLYLRQSEWKLWEFLSTVAAQLQTL